MDKEELIDKIVNLILKIEGVEENNTLRNHLRSLDNERLECEYNFLRNSF